MNAESNAFMYDDFERYLLDAAKIDEAPANLPSRVGVALGVGVPVLAAVELASVAPTTTSLSAGTGVIPGVTTSKGLFAALKASLGIGSSTLWGTAAKGIAVGVLSGAAVVGSGRALVGLTDNGPPTASTAQSSHDRRAGVSGSMVATRANAARGSEEAAVEAAPPAPKAEDAVDDVSTEVDASNTSNRRELTGHPESSQFVAYVGSAADSSPEKAPVRRLARPIFPEKTSAIARYPLIYEDVSALYDAPTKKSPVTAASAAPTVDPGTTIDAAELRAMRSKTLSQARTLLGQSRAAQALRELDAFRKRVGERNFGVDEFLLRIESLAILGRAKEAQADVAHVERLAPNSAALRQAQQLAGSRFVR